MSLPPGPPLPMLAQTVFWIRRPIEFLTLCRERYGSSFTVKLPPATMVFLTEPEDIKTVFTAKPDEMHAGEVNRILRVLLGENSVLLLDGAEHMRQRKLLLPPFHGERMRHYGRTMVDITEQVTREWPERTPFSLHPHTQEITLEIILRTVFGAEEGAEATELRDQMRRMLSLAESRALVLPMTYLSRHPELEARRPWKWFLRRRNRTDRLLYRQIAARRAEGTGKHREDVLGMLLEAKDEDGNGMTDAELRDELMTTLAAGHETTATSLAWAVERLLTTPRTYEKLAAEVRSATKEGGVDPEVLASLPYLDATVKEVLRLRPVVPVVGRVLKKPFHIAGHDLPAGSVVAPCIYLAQRNPRVFDEPEEFRPERFLENPPDPFSFLPFGGGVRRCIGAAFAQYEMKLVLGTILHRFDLELAQPAPVRIVRRAITFFPELGTRIRVTRRA
ncbi:MAG TPA: cytochrome P450 [Polyangiaceae bacterium]|nr:cytochrome P450 [Polyangiaceae bacterium]